MLKADWSSLAYKLGNQLAKAIALILYIQNNLCPSGIIGLAMFYQLERGVSIVG